MKLTSSQIGYLLAIHSLGPETPIRLAPLARELGVSRSSVYKMLLRLKEAGLVQADERGGFSLTSAGKQILYALLIVFDRVLSLFRPDFQEQPLAREYAALIVKHTGVRMQDAFL